MNKKQKQPYRFRNWREYNAALVSHGSLTIWLDEAALGGWLHGERSGKRGASLTYGDATIQAALLLKAVYRPDSAWSAGFYPERLEADAFGVAGAALQHFEP